jgi:hypothetical protein
MILRNVRNRRQNAPVTIGSITSPDPEFQPSSNCNGIVLDPGGRCVVTLTFSPDVPGLRWGTLSIPCNAKNGVQTVILKGRGR